MHPSNGAEIYPFPTSAATASPSPAPPDLSRPMEARVILRRFANLFLGTPVGEGANANSREAFRVLLQACNTKMSVELEVQMLSAQYDAHGTVPRWAHALIVACITEDTGV